MYNNEQVTLQAIRQRAEALRREIPTLSKSDSLDRAAVEKGYSSYRQFYSQLAQSQGRRGGVR